LSRFAEYREKALTEKIYAHIDRDFYLTGETLWFKLYAADGCLHRPLDISKVAYVELLGTDGEPVLQAKILMEEGRGHGSLFLPASLATGNYRFRAYTHWMKNFPPGFFYHQVISIVNPFLVPDQRTEKKESDLRVWFFPEGGHLVNGLESKIAFRITDHTGRGVNRPGAILDGKGDTIASILPQRFGLGHFVMTPYTGVRYRVVLASTGAANRHSFPEVQEAGYVMRLEETTERLSVSVRTSGVGDGPLFLFAHSRNIVAVAKVGRPEGNRVVFHLNKRDVPEGICHITLFNEQLQPVCERLYFKHPDRKLGIDLQISQKTPGPRKKVSVSLATSVPANLSMAVFRLDSLTPRYGKEIYPYLWLTSDLAGVVESPEYYFGDTAAMVRSQMDNLMLTHGWRRFDWEAIRNQTPAFPFLPETREHIVTAVVKEDGQPRRSVFVHLGSPGKIVRAYGAWTNAEGEARFEIKDFYGPRRIIVEGAGESAGSFDITIADPFYRDPDEKSAPPLLIRETMKNDLQMRSIAMQVQDIYYYEEYGTRVQIPAVDSTAFYGEADATYFLDDYTRFPLMEEVMREYVPGVFVRKRKDGFHFVVVDEANRGVLAGDPMVLLDGVPITDVDDIMKIDPLRVRKLEVVKRPYHLGQAAFSGIVSYTTYQGDLGGLELNPRSISLDYEGLQMKRIFHQPRYDQEEISQRMPDQRFLLHWEPDIATGANDRHQVAFFTSDVPGQYVIVVQGLSEDGRAGTATTVFTVAPPVNE